MRYFMSNLIFAAALLFAVVGTCLYYWIMARVARAGIQVRFYAGFRDNLKMFRAYRDLATSRQWSLWPFYAYWVAVVGMFVVFVMLAVHSRK
jgi:hypothetical protein